MYLYRFICFCTMGNRSLITTLRQRQRKGLIASDTRLKIYIQTEGRPNSCSTAIQSHLCR